MIKGFFGCLGWGIILTIILIGVFLVSNETFMEFMKTLFQLIGELMILTTQLMKDIIEYLKEL